jgi:hypothetical protein
MSSAQAEASDAARSLARARWGTRVLDHAVEVVVNRSADLDAAQREQLRAVADGPAEDGDAE